MESHKKKMVAPIVVTILVVIYYAFYFGVLITLLDYTWRYIFGIFPIVFSVIMIKVCIERINEIKEGEEDDISQY